MIHLTLIIVVLKALLKIKIADYYLQSFIVKNFHYKKKFYRKNFDKI